MIFALVRSMAFKNHNFVQLLLKHFVPSPSYCRLVILRKLSNLANEWIVEVVEKKVRVLSKHQSFLKSWSTSGVLNLFESVGDFGLLRGKVENIISEWLSWE